MNYFKTSNGERVSKATIDRRVHEAKARKIDQMITDYGYVFCEEVNCGRNASSGVFIDCSHEISVDRCQKEGRAELAYDVNNIKMRCRPCHNKHDKLQ